MTLQPATKEQVPEFALWCDLSTDSTLSEQTLFRYLHDQGLVSIHTSADVVGFIAYRQIGPEAELDQILLKAAARGKGFAKVALQQWHTELQSRNVEQVFLEVRSGNEVAINLYNALGYEPVGLRRGYYSVGDQKEDAVLMRLIF